MSFIIDLILVAVLVFTVFNGYRKGFIKTLFGLAGFFIALIIASALSGEIGMRINDSFAQAAAEEVISSSLAESLDDGEIQQVIEKIGEYAPNEEIEKRLTETFVEKGEESIEAISRELAEKVSVPMCRAAAFFALFVLSYFVARIAAYFLDKVFRLPVLHFANSWLGLAVGALCGILIVMVLSRSFECMLPWLCRTYPDAFSEGLISNTFVLKFFCEYNLFSTLFVGVAGIIN